MGLTIRSKIVACTKWNCVWWCREWEFAQVRTTWLNRTWRTLDSVVVILFTKRIIIDENSSIISEPEENLKLFVICCLLKSPFPSYLWKFLSMISSRKEICRGNLWNVYWHVFTVATNENKRLRWDKFYSSLKKLFYENFEFFRRRENVRGWSKM